MNHIFNFDSEITEDLNLYAGFTKYEDDKIDIYLKIHQAEDYYDEKDEPYTEEGKENFNLNHLM